MARRKQTNRRSSTKKLRTRRSSAKKRVTKQTKRKISGKKLRTRKALAKKRVTKKTKSVRRTKKKQRGKLSMKMKKVPSLKKQKRSSKKGSSTKKVTSSRKRGVSSRKRRRRTRQQVSRKRRRKLNVRIPRNKKRQARPASIQNKLAQNIEDFSKKPHEVPAVNDHEAAKPDTSPVVFVTTPKGLSVSCPVDLSDGQGRIFIGSKDGGVLLVESHFDNNAKPEKAKAPADAVTVMTTSEECKTEDSAASVSTKTAEKEYNTESYEFVEQSTKNKARKRHFVDSSDHQSLVLKKSPTAADSEKHYSPRFAQRKNNADAQRFGEARRRRGEHNIDNYN